jgi:hypothetical protein
MAPFKTHRPLALCSGRPRGFPLCALAALCCLLGPAASAAQIPYVAIVGATHGQDSVSVLTQLAAALAEQLDERGLSALPQARAAELLERTQSRPLQPVSAADVESLEREAQAASEALSEGRTRETRTRVARVQTLADADMDTFGREAKARNAIFKACVAGIQANLQSDDLAAAQTLSTWCISAFPGLDPNKATLTKSVRAALLEAQSAVRASGRPPLQINSAPPGCALFVQGKHVGETDYTLQHPAPRPYSAQVQCGQGLVSRVHVLEPDSRSTFVIDVGFDAALKTTPQLVHLDYASPSEDVIRNHALRIRSFLSAAEVIVLQVAPAGRITIRRLEKSNEVSVDIPRRFEADDLRRALSTLYHSFMPDESSTTPPGEEGSQTDASATEEDGAQRVEEAATEVPDQSSPERGAWRLWTGLPLLTAAAVTFTVSGALLHKRLTAGERYQRATPASGSYLPRQRAWREKGKPLHATAIAGSALGAFGAGLVVGEFEPDRHVWLPVGALVLAAPAVVLGALRVAQNEQCNDRNAENLKACVVGQGKRDRGGIALLAAAPLLVFSTGWFVRWLMPGFDANVAARASSKGFELTASGRF